MVGDIHNEVVSESKQIPLNKQKTADFQRNPSQEILSSFKNSDENIQDSK